MCIEHGMWKTLGQGRNASYHEQLLTHKRLIIASNTLLTLAIEESKQFSPNLEFSNQQRLGHKIRMKTKRRQPQEHRMHLQSLYCLLQLHHHHHHHHPKEHALVQRARFQSMPTRGSGNAHARKGVSTTVTPAAAALPWTTIRTGGRFPIVATMWGGFCNRSHWLVAASMPYVYEVGKMGYLLAYSSLQHWGMAWHRWKLISCRMRLHWSDWAVTPYQFLDLINRWQPLANHSVRVHQLPKDEPHQTIFLLLLSRSLSRRAQMVLGLASPQESIRESSPSRSHLQGWTKTRGLTMPSCPTLPSHRSFCH